METTAVIRLRLELMTPQGDLVQSETYNKLFTMHGLIMIFFFLIPAIPAVLGNFLVPMMLGVRDLAFPRLKTAKLVDTSEGLMYHPFILKVRSECAVRVWGGTSAEGGQKQGRQNIARQYTGERLQ